MRGRIFLCAIFLLAPVAGRAQTPQKRDSVAKADSIAQADSIALVKQLEKELGSAPADTGNAADPTSNPNPAGSVAAAYRIGKFEISSQMIDNANALTP